MSARMSACGQYRYELRRPIDPYGSGIVTFVMLNPSTADATVDDPTIRRCIGFAKRWGMSEVVVVNLWPLRATDPEALLSHPDPDGPGGDSYENESTVDNVIAASSLVVAAWGSHVVAMERIGRTPAPLIVESCEDVGVPLRCLGLTKHGHPRHPLYVRGDATLVHYPPEKAAGR